MSHIVTWTNEPPKRFKLPTAVTQPAKPYVPSWLARPCDGCNAEASESCRPLCIARDDEQANAS